ncbi:hypothetical protein QYE76_059693 [Lolium multiflorum]|uniref:F-box domain-containing protein n=1 Tax=Lolium multiflorum TaxID=4521 RepID=A0AAD8RZ20_LOLMU|nr:hypothetical protein QYE76_059693 [Lolium multiflorum]
MELRSGRLVRSLPTPPPRPSRRPPGFPDGDGSDRISALPDEMLLEILGRLRCARAAAHTSGLSRRWRGLWRHLRELSFRDMSADAADAALGQVAGQALSFLEVDIPYKHRVPEPARVSALLHAAARLAPADLVFSFSLRANCKYGNFPFEIPSFQRATSIKLRVRNHYLIPPAGAVEFPLLEKLSVACSRIDTAELVRRCPRLRVFEIQFYPSRDVAANRIKVHSPTIEDLAVDIYVQLDRLDIIAPVLKRFSLRVNMAKDSTVSFSAPMVENIYWFCSFQDNNVGFGEKWRLSRLKLVMEENVGVLHMLIYWKGYDVLPDRTFSQEIAQLLAFSVLELELELDLQSKIHGIGALVSHLLGVCSSIRRLKVDIRQYYWHTECSPNCPCHQPQNWRNEIISLKALEEVELTGCDGTENDVDLLKLLFRCAPLMKSMTVVLAPESSLPTDQDCEEIYSMFEANPQVKCSVYRSPSKG